MWEVVRCKSVRRARKMGARYEVVDPLLIFERDGWKCRMCGKKTPLKYRGTIRQDAPELDHIISLALGGVHARTNLQCLCRKCNQEKGMRAQAQLLLC